MSTKESEMGINPTAIQLSRDDILPIRQRVTECLYLGITLKQRREEREQQNREKRARVETILHSLLEKNLVERNHTIQKNLESLSISRARAGIKSAPLASLDQLRREVAHSRLKVMASRRSQEDPTLSETQYEILKIVRQLITSETGGQSMADRLYRDGKGDHGPVLQRYEKQARDLLISIIARKTSKKDCAEIIAKNIYLQELSWLRKEIASALEAIANIEPRSQVQDQNSQAGIIAQAAYEIRIRQAGDPVNPQEIRRLTTEALVLRRPLKIVVIKCLAHDYKTGRQKVTSIYDDESLVDKEGVFLEYILEYQKMLRELDIPSEIIVAVADTDIPYQREESLDSEKWADTQAQIVETRSLYQKYGIPVLSLMGEIEKDGLKNRHDEVYLEVKQKPLTYIPSVYLERRINKRYKKYRSLENMTRGRARRVVINSYAEEAALGEIWKELWGNCVHLVYKTTYLAMAMESCRNQKNEPSKNIPTIFSSGQGKRGSDGEEDQ